MRAQSSQFSYTDVMKNIKLLEVVTPPSNNQLARNIKVYVSDIQEPYKDTIIGHLVNSGTEDLLLHIVQCRRACAGDKENSLCLWFCTVCK